MLETNEKLAYRQLYKNQKNKKVMYYQLINNKPSTIIIAKTCFVFFAKFDLCFITSINYPLFLY